MIFAEVEVNGICARATCKRLIPAGLIGGQVSFRFTDPRWDSLNKTVVFKGFGTKDVQMDGDTTTIPAEVVSRRGARLKVGIYGTDAQNDIAIPTLWADLGEVRDAADPSGDPSTDPSMPVWAQIQRRVDSLIRTGEGQYIETDGTLSLKDGVLSVNTTDVVEEDNTLPVTSAAVHTVIGNIGAILDTI